MTKEEVLQQCTIDGNIVRLPKIQLDRKLYLDTAKALNLIGGKWTGGKVAGFVFPVGYEEELQSLINKLAGGEKLNPKKEYQFFETPIELARQLIYYADIDRLNCHLRILEPEAGQGAIVKVIFEKENIRQVDCCELMEINRTFLEKIEGVLIIANDFFSLSDAYNDYYDRIIANPPFTNNQDIDHIRKMYECLKTGGRLVTVASKHWEIASGRKETEFKNWLDNLGADIIQISDGTFKESGTMVGGFIIIIDK